MARPKKIIKEAKKSMVTKPTAARKMTVIRQMSFGQYCQALWAIENPDQFNAGLMLDMSIYKAEQTEVVDKRRFYVTEQQRKVLDDFCRMAIVRRPVKDLLATLEKDPRFLTAPDIQTYKYKDISPALSPVVPTQADLTTTPAVPVDTAGVGEPNYQPAAQYHVFDDKERMQLAIKLQKKAVDGEMLNSVGLPYFDTVDMSQYLFIKDLNKQVQDISEIDYHVLFYMIETRKISPIEAKLVLIKVGAGGVPDKRPHDLLKYGVPRFYDEDSTMLSAMIKAETFAYKYDKMLADGDPDPDYIFERFKDHISNEIFPSVKYPQMLDFQYNKNIDIKDISINNDTVTVTYDDIIEGDEGVTADIKYTDRDLLLNDFVCYERTFKIDPNRQHNVWGETMSINDYIKKLYVQYPHGINGDFYATMKEAYEAGAACINEIA